MPFITRNVHYKFWMIFRHGSALTLIAITRYLGNWCDLEIYSNAHVRLTKINLRGRCSPFFFFFLLSLFSCSERNFWRETWSLSPATFAQRFVQFCEIIKESRVAVRSAEVCTVVTNHCHFRLNMPGERSVPRHFYAAETYAITFVSLILLTTKTSFEKRVQAFRKWTWT